MPGGMQDWPLRLTRLFDHAAREHGPREIVDEPPRTGTGKLLRTTLREQYRDHELPGTG